MNYVETFVKEQIYLSDLFKKKKKILRYEALRLRLNFPENIMQIGKSICGKLFLNVILLFKHCCNRKGT